jgi:phosphate/sulfate permease
MDTIFLVIAAIAAVIGLGLMFWRWRVGKELAVMASTATSGAGSVAQLPPGTLAEVMGTLRVRTPLIAEFSQQPCAYYKSEIEREETYYERDSNGREERKTRTSTVYSNVQFGQCLVEDQSGRVGIDFDGAHVEAIGIVNEPTAAPNAASGIVGGVLSALSNTNSRYQRKESILPADIPIYVIGEVQPGGLIGKHAKESKNRLFVISHKSKDERTKSLTSTTRRLLIISVVLFALAAGLLAWGAAKGTTVKAAANVTQRA